MHSIEEVQVVMKEEQYELVVVPSKPGKATKVAQILNRQPGQNC